MYSDYIHSIDHIKGILLVKGGPPKCSCTSLPVMYTERTLEDHEKVLRCLTHWPRTHTNSVLFKNNPEKYYLLKRPQLLMPASHAYSSVNPTRTTFTEEQKKNIILKVSLLSLYES